MLISVDLIAYTAGMIDGEGSIQINPSRSGKKYYWYLTVQISSGDKKTLQDLRNEWGEIGSITVWKPKGSRKYRQSCNWRFYNKEAEFLLNKVLPFLRIKKEYALTAIEFRKFRGKGPKSLTAEMIKKRKFLALKLKRLNQRYGKGQVDNSIWKGREVR